MKKLLFCLFAMCFMGTLHVSAQMYVRGSFSAWNGDYPMDAVGSVFTAQSVYMPGGSEEMKFEIGGYASSWGGGTGDTGTAVSGAPGNITFTLADTGYYDVVFDSTLLTYRVTKLPYTASNPDMWASGTFNGWGTTNRMILVGNHTWQTSAPIALTAASYSMKFRNNDSWAGADWGNASGLSGTASVTTGGGANLTFAITTADNYTITFNDSSLAYSITGTSSVPVVVTVAGPMVTTAPVSIIDSDEDVVIHFHPYSDTLGSTVGDVTLRSFGGTIFIYTGLSTTPSTGGWNHTNPTWAATSSFYAMTRVDSNDYTYNLSDLRTFYGVGADTAINTIHLIFKDSLGTIQSSTVDLPVTAPSSVTTSTVTVSSGPMVTTSPATIIDSAEDVVIHFHPYWDTLGSTVGDGTLRSFGGTIFIYTGLSTTPSTGGWNHTNPTWAATSSYYAMTRVDSNDYTYNLSDLRAFYGVGADTAINIIHLIFKDSLGTIQSSTVDLPVAPPLSSSITGVMFSTSPVTVVDSTESVTIIFHPYWDSLTGFAGDTSLRHTTGDIYIYTGILANPTPGPGSWIHTNTTGWGASDPYYKMTRVDSNTYTYTIPDLRAYYVLAGTDTLIDSVAVIFTSGNGDTQTSTVFIPVVPAAVTSTVVATTGPMFTVSPAPVVDSDESVVIHFHPYWDTLAGTAGDVSLRSFGGTIFIYTGLYTHPSTGGWNHTNPTWAASSSYYAMTKVDSNDYTYTIGDLRAFYGVGADTAIDTINVIFKDSLGTIQASTIYIPVVPPAIILPGTGPVVTTSISPVIDSSEGVVITFHPFWDTLHGYAGDSTFRTTTGSIYFYSGVLASPTPGAGVWIHTNTSGWGASDPYYRMTRVDSNTYTYSIPDLRSFYGLAGTDTLIDSLALIFTSATGDAQTSNIFVPVRRASTEGVATISFLGNELNMLLMPNPATNEVSAIVNTGNNTDGVIRVIDQLGRSVLVQNIGKLNGKITLPLNGLATGVYFVELTAGDKKNVQRLIKQ
jgi:hypothetical protein